MDLGLADTTAVVVGGSGRMGFATARCFAGAAVTELTQRGSSDAVGLTADIGDGDAVGAVFGELAERWDGELNALVVTAGPGVAGTFEDLTDDQWRRPVEDGVLGMVRCVRAALPLLPDDVGPVAALLASRRNSYMTGAHIDVGGGSDFT